LSYLSKRNSFQPSYTRFSGISGPWTHHLFSNRNEFHFCEEISILSKLLFISEQGCAQEVLQSCAKHFNATKNNILAKLRSVTIYIPQKFIGISEDSSKSPDNPYYQLIQEIFDEHCYSGEDENKPD